ncbi:uncharacterized protein [Triticum aestivum]|uniref:uncharacterized protein n=1 Tax=Triticum aestivum TaxID=4565 RepID=UPI001D0088E7|nr:uncharacterized protein LOC123154530 [Triticum aestivum]
MATARSTKRARSHGAPSTTTLPDDALLEIFARLPAKSVGRLRCVSRSWAATLKSAPFVDLHLREANRRRQPTPRLFFTTAHPDSRWQLDEVLTKPCHGLVLIHRLPHHGHFVCNPSTGALLPLPDSHRCQRRNGESYGLGYSPATKEHKVVRLFSSFHSTPCCEVLSLDVSAHWRAVARQCPPSRAAVRDDPAVLCDGYLHFLHVRRKHGGSILTFDVGDETFGSLSTPPSVQDDDGPPELTVLGGRLCLCVFHECRPPTRSDADPYCIWWLACRESEQWEKLYRVLHPQTLRPELDLLRVHWVYPLETYLASNGQKKIMFATEEGVLAFDLDGSGVPVPEVLVSPMELVSARDDDEEATITRGTVGLLEESLVPVGRTSEEVIFSSPWRKAWSDVLKWMPAQAVAALTCVCREWRAVAETDRFVRTHALHANLKWSPRVMVVQAQPYTHVLDFYPLELCESLQVRYDVADMAPPFLFDHHVWRTVCSTPCHGLVLVSYTRQAGSGPGVVDFICNPSMEYSRLIRTDTLDDDDDDDSPRHSAAATMGLGYDSRTNKHVLAHLVVVRPDKSRRHHRPVKVRCHVQLVGATTWIPISPPPRPPAVDMQPVYADGKLYWMVEDADDNGSRGELLALDVGAREFEVLPGPPCGRGRITSIVELQGNVCVLCSDTSANAIDVWKRLEYGSWSAWPCRIELGEFRRMYPSEETTLLAVDPRDGRVLLSTGRALGYYDPEARAVQTVYCVGEHLQDMKFAPTLCHESLIRPRTYY